MELMTEEAYLARTATSRFKSIRTLGGYLSCLKSVSPHDYDNNCDSL